MINDRGQLYCIDFIKNFDLKTKKAEQKILSNLQDAYKISNMEPVSLKMSQEKEGPESSEEENSQMLQGAVTETEPSDSPKI